MSKLAELHREMARVHLEIAQELEREEQAGVKRWARRGKRGPLKPRPAGDGVVSDLAKARARRMLEDE